jgi:hypothetical protein
MCSKAEKWILHRDECIRVFPKENSRSFSHRDVVVRDVAVYFLPNVVHKVCHVNPFKYELHGIDGLGAKVGNPKGD